VSAAAEQLHVARLLLVVGCATRRGVGGCIVLGHSVDIVGHLGVR
jgi:hypothetical protein